jgi:phage gp36-like protein
MTYATQADMIDRFGAEQLTRLSDRSGVVDTLDAAVIATALEDAAAEIDAHLAGRVALPLPAVPRLLTRIACDLAYADLLGDRIDAVKGAEGRRDAAREMLRQIRAGDLALGDETPGDTQPVTGGGARVTAPDPVFSRTTLEGF